MSMVFLDLVVLIAVVSVVVLALSMVTQRQKRHSEQTKLLAEALKNPAVDRATLESLTYQLTGRRPPRQERGRGGFMAWMLAIGWIGLFLGVGLLVGGVNAHDRDLELAGWIVGLIGFGFVTYPFALRELESRRAA